MQIIQLQTPGMEPIAPVSRSGDITDALIVQVERITKQGRPQLREMDADLMRATRCDRHLQTISLGTAFQQRQFAVGFQTSPDEPIRWGQRSPDPAQQGMGPLDHIRIHRKRHPELKPCDTLGPGLIELSGS